MSEPKIEPWLKEAIKEIHGKRRLADFSEKDMLAIVESYMPEHAPSSPAAPTPQGDNQ